jgi:hypothetical protein
MTVSTDSSEAFKEPLSLTTRFTGFVVLRRRQLYVLAIGGLFLACLGRYWMHFDAQGSVPRKMEMARTAINLYEKGQFSNPFFIADTGPTAHVAPAFPVYMALLMHAFGDNAQGLFALRISAALIVAFQVALFPLLSQSLGMGRLTGFIAACTWIVAKPLLEWNWEGYYAALLIAITCCVYRMHLDSTSKRPKSVTWLLGFLIGLLMLLSPAIALVLAAWLGWEIWRRKSAFLETSFLPLVLLPALVVSPWLIRNYLVFDRLVIRDDFGLELAVSNNDCAQFAARINFDSGCANNVHPNGSLTEAKKVSQMGEVHYNDQRLREAALWIKSHQTRFLRLTVMRFIAFWLPTETGTIHYAGTGRRIERSLIYVMTLLSISGVWILYRRNIKSAYVCMSCLILYPLVYYIVQFVDRYRYPILWLTFLLGSLPISRLLGTIFPTRRLILSAAAVNLPSPTAKPVA